MVLTIVLRFVLIIGGLATAAAPVQEALAPGAQIGLDLNIVRAANHLAPLTSRADLAEVAQERAEEIASGAQPWGHTGKDGDLRFVTLLEAHHVGGWWWGENLVMSNQGNLPERAVGMWMASPPHAAIILDPNYSAVGIGCAANADAVEVCAAIFWGGGP